MRKKLLVIWFIIIAGLFAWTSLRRQNQDVQTLTNKAESTSTQDASDIDHSDPFPIEDSNTKAPEETEIVDIKQHAAYEDVRNYNVTDEDLLDKWQGREEELSKFLLTSSKQLTECLKKDLCGEQADPDSPYFNPNATPSHTLLERELGTLIFMRESNKLDVTALPTQQMEEMLDIQNEAIQSLALELRLAAGIDDAAYDRLLERTPSLLPQASASSLVQLARESRQSQGRRDELVKTAEKLLSSDDQMQAIEMAKRVKYLGADKDEIERFAKTTCKLLDQNKKTVQNYLALAGEGVGANLKFECP